MRKTRWFRVYDNLVDDPKVQLLPAETFKLLINLWCLASANDGRLPTPTDIAFKLRVTRDATHGLLHELMAVGLIDDIDGTLRPHNWGDRQFHSDADPTAAQRSRRYRDKKLVTRDATVTSRPPETDTDIDCAPRSEKPLSRKRKQVGLPDGWGPKDLPSSDDLCELPRFRDHARATGRTCADWEAAWRNWLRSPFRRPSGKQTLNEILI